MSTKRGYATPSVELGTPLTQRICTAFVAVLLLLTYQPTTYVQADEPGLVVFAPVQIDYIQKPLITLTKITPEPKPVQIKKKYTKVSILKASTKGENSYPVAYNSCSCVSAARYFTGINIGSIGLAINHPINTRQPSVGAIVVMKSGRTGHLAAIISIDGDTITIKEANWVRCKTSTRVIRISDPSIIGYYNP